MRITESQLRRIVRRMINEQATPVPPTTTAATDPSLDIIKRFMKELNRSAPWQASIGYGPGAGDSVNVQVVWGVGYNRDPSWKPRHNNLASSVFDKVCTEAGLESVGRNQYKLPDGRVIFVSQAGDAPGGEINWLQKGIRGGF